MKRLWMVLLGVIGVFGFLLVGPTGPAMAATSTRFVTQIHDGSAPDPSDPSDHNWYREDTNVGGGVIITNEFGGAPTGFGGSDNSALALTTDYRDSAKAQVVNHEVVGTNLSDVTDLSYWTYQANEGAAAAPGGSATVDPSFQLPILANGNSGFATLVFEPYQAGEGPITPQTWQQWDVDAGLFWSTRSFTCGATTFPGSPGGPATITLAAVKAACTSAKVLSYGASIGGNNANYTVGVDGIVFSSTANTFRNDFGPK